MTRSRKIVAWIVGVVLALIVLLVIMIALFDWNRLKPFINDKVSQAIGRPFAINGDLTVEWKRERDGGGIAAWVPWPEFTARDITIANPGWAKQPRFATLHICRFQIRARTGCRRAGRCCGCCRNCRCCTAFRS